MRFWGLLVSSPLIFIGLGTVTHAEAAQSAGEVTELAIPCVKEGSSEANKSGLRQCSVFVPDAKSLLKKRVLQQAENYYNGCQYDSSKPVPAEAGACQGNRIPKETCNVLDTAGVPKTFNSIVEETTNHASLLTEIQRSSASCGAWPTFQTSVSGHTCNITPVYSGSNQIEDAYNRGAFIQSLNCFHQQVEREIEQGKIRLSKLTAADGTSVPLVCAEMAKKFIELSDSVRNSMQTTQQAGVANLSDADNCTDLSTNNGGVDHARQSACYLQTLRYSVEAMFLQLAACEVFVRSMASYDRFLGIGATRDEVKEQARNQINGVTGGQGLCNHTTILTNYYKPNYFTLFKARANAIWNESACKAQ